jgi:hypothetical protein
MADILDHDDFEMTITRLRLLLTGARGIDIDGFLATIQRQHTVGPVLDPTMYRDAHGGLRNLQKLGEAARPLVKLTQDIDAGKVK